MSFKAAEPESNPESVRGQRSSEYGWRLTLPPLLRTTLRPLRPGSVVSITHVVTRTIREAILKGALPPGTRLQQDRLAAELQVSRQPVREALRHLQAEGLVVQLPQRWMAVQTFSADAIRENYGLRSILEAEAARAAALAIRPAELTRLKDTTKAMARAAADGKANAKITNLNHQFHRLIWESSRMPTLLRLVEQLWVGRTIFTPLFIPGRARRSVTEHNLIIDALERHDPAAAGERMQAHIAHAAEEYFANHDREVGLAKDQSPQPAGSARHTPSAAGAQNLPSREAEHPC